MLASGRDRLAALARSVGPSLRVVGLTYTGLLGIMSLVVVLGVALSPVSPTLQQVTEPARQAVTDFVQPNAEAVTTFFGGAPVVVVVAPPLSPSNSVTITVADISVADEAESTSEMTGSDVFETGTSVFETGTSTDVAAPEPPAPSALFGPQPVAEAEVALADEASISEESADEEAAPTAPEIAPEPAPIVVQPADTSGLRIASDAAPVGLPTVLPETPQQMKARLDAENDAAIEAARQARARARAEADAANQAAIDALKAASAAATAAAKGAPAPTARPTADANPSPTPTAALAEVVSLVQDQPSTTSKVAVTPQPATPPPTTVPLAAASATARAAANAANQAAIDAARAERARVKAEANAANSAAIDAARGKSAVQASPTATPDRPTTPEPNTPPRTAVDAIALDAPESQDSLAAAVAPCAEADADTLAVAPVDSVDD